MKTCLIILSLLFAFIFDCKGQVWRGNEYKVLPPLKVVDSAGKRYIKIDPVDVYPKDEERSASIQVLLKMMRDSGIATMPFISGIAISRWRDTSATKYDTVKVIMLVCNTENKYSFEKEMQGKGGFQLDSNWTIVMDTLNKQFYECDYNVHWQYGYSVAARGSIFIVEYLDADKIKLPKNIIVWMAKPI